MEFAQHMQQKDKIHVGQTLSHLCSAAFLVAAMAGAVKSAEAAALSIPPQNVKITGGFWAERIRVNRENTLPHVLAKCDETGRIRNFARAAHVDVTPHEGPGYNDSDVYKIMEGLARALGITDDEKLRARLQELAKAIAEAQEHDGYLHTKHTAAYLKPSERWGDDALYNAGHLFEAAVAHYETTGEKSLLTVAQRFADLIDETYGPDKIRAVPYHPEVELALIKLSDAASEQRYFKLAETFLEMRGYGNRQHCQDHAPVAAQTEAVGHCVCAMYLYCAMTDVAARGDEAHPYRKALESLWDDVTNRKMYVTGGIGVAGCGEGFGPAYELPNDKAYAETCAAIGMVLWSHRMFRMTGDARYADIMERAMYNAALPGVAWDGKRFFYGNPMACRGGAGRSSWFDCACCPSNIARFIPSLPGFVYALSAERDALMAVHYLDCALEIAINGIKIRVVQKTDYPLKGDVEFRLEPEAPIEFAFLLRIPDWAGPALTSTTLYGFDDEHSVTPENVKLTLNGEQQNSLPVQAGFLAVKRRWQKGDVLRLELPLRPRRLYSSSKIKNNRGLVALSAGPLVFCFEECDNPVPLDKIALPRSSELKMEFVPDLLGGLPTIVARGIKIPEHVISEKYEPVRLCAVPYFAWNNRSAGEMRIWIPEREE